MSDHVHKWLPYPHTYSDGATFIHAKCICGERIDEPELRCRLNEWEKLKRATEVLSARNAKFYANVFNETRPPEHKEATDLQKYADILKDKDE